MAIWNRNKSKTKLDESQKSLTEASNMSQLDVVKLLGQPYYNFASSLTSLRGNTSISSTIKESMLKDPIISRVINMWMDDTLSTDIVSGKIFDVEITDNHSKKSKEEIEKMIQTASDSIDYLLENSNIIDSLNRILYKVITDGNVSVKLGFVDLYEDTKIKLFETNKKKASKLLESETFTDKDKRTKFLEATNYDDYVNDTMSYNMKTKKHQNV